MLNPATQLITPGELITNDQQFMRGHGTFFEHEITESEESTNPTNNMLASVCGTVQRVNKLISVLPVKSRYEPEIGDLIVGRITEVGAKRWRVDIRSRQDAILLLSSVTLPGGIQRRRQESDELQMRECFAEGDMLVAEVQQFFHDGAVSLHTRSLKYGKLKSGMLITVPANLIKRSKTHFHFLPIGVDALVGVNGMIWIRKHTPDLQAAEVEADESLLYSNDNLEIDRSTRENMARVRNCISLLSQQNIRIDAESIMQAYELSLTYPAKQLLQPAAVEQIASQIY